jgi:hypothetical protein
MVIVKTKEAGAGQVLGRCHDYYSPFHLHPAFRFRISKQLLFLLHAPRLLLSSARLAP